MAELLGSAVIDVSVNANSVNQSLNKLKQNAAQTATIIDRKFAASFNRIAEASSRMARMASNSLRAIAIPMVGAIGVGIKKYLDSGSVAANQAKAKFDELKKSLDAVGVRLGKLFLESKVLGKTPLEWVDKLIKKLNSISDEQLKNFIESLKTILGLFIALKGTIAAIEISKDVTKLLSEIPKAAAKTATAQATGQALGSAVGAKTGAAAGVGAGAYMANKIPFYNTEIIPPSKQLTSGYTASTKTGGTALRGHIGSKSNWTEVVAFGDRSSKSMRAVSNLFSKFASMFSKIAGPLSKITSIGGIILKKIPIVLVVWDMLVGVWEGIKDTFKSFQSGDSTLFAGIGKVLSTIITALMVFSTALTGAVRILVNALNFGEGWIGRIETAWRSTMDKIGKIIYEAIYKEEAELAAKVQAQLDRNKEVLKPDPEITAHLNEMTAKSFENIETTNYNLFDKMKEKSGSILSNFVDMFEKEKDREKIIAQAEKKQLDLKKEANNITRSFNQSMQDLEDERLQSLKANSGIFLGGMEAIKLSQQIEAGSGTREAEYKKRVEELTKKNNEELEENNSVLDSLNKNFTQFFQLINKGRDAKSVAEALGL